jgi:non-specific serine/threonine protein kinase/serine/threonine-protein kinase
LTPERWQRVKDILGPALEMQPAQRAAYLEKACFSDASLRADVNRLLIAGDEAGPAFLSGLTPAKSILGEDDAKDRWIGRRIGAYEIIERIGVGGMGEVFRARRADDQYKREVAIKLVRVGADADSVIRRFKHERQVLASLDHPNIAHLLDAGTTPDGAPYVVMDLIEGEPIDNYCNSHDLSTTARLELFLQVCSAAQYAHQRLIIHRDIKPTNILVTKDGVAKLLDFGISKILHPDTVDDSFDPTMTMFRLLTPGYASPEQIKGEAITTATDVYSLGVVLYELLTGHHPYRNKDDSVEKIARAVCEVEPRKPSSVVGVVATAARDHSRQSAELPLARDRQRLSRQLTGDLDNIILMALRKESERRYSSVEQFAGDIRRHLQSLPVIARHDTFSYRASKFVTRHRGAVAAAVVVALVLLAGVTITRREAQIARAQQARAERRFSDLRRLAHSLVFEIHDSVEAVPGTITARKLITQRSLEYLDSLAQEAEGEWSLQGELAAAYTKVGDVQGQSYNANLGDTQGALASYRKALAIRQTLAVVNPDDATNRLELAKSHNKVGDVLAKMGDLSGASASFQEARLIAEPLVAQDPTNLDKGHELILTYTRSGYVLEDMGDNAASLASHREALATAQSQISYHAADALACHDLATSYNNVGHQLAKAGRVREGLEVYRKGLAVCEWRSADDPNSTQTNTRGWLDDFLEMGRMLTELGTKKEAFENLNKALAIGRRLATADPQNAQASSDLAACYEGIGDSQVAFGETGMALRSYGRAITIWEQLSTKDPENAEVRAELASSYAKLGQTHIAMASNTKIRPANRVEHWREARSWLRRSLKVWTNMRLNGTLPGSNASQPESMAAQVARCDNELKKITDKVPRAPKS